MQPDFRFNFARGKVMLSTKEYGDKSIRAKLLLEVRSDTGHHLEVTFSSFNLKSHGEIAEWIDRMADPTTLSAITNMQPKDVDGHVEHLKAIVRAMRRP